MAADRLRPQAERALRTAAAARVDRHIRVVQVADEVIFDLQVALVDGCDERQLVHVFEDRARFVVLDRAVLGAVAHAQDPGKRLALGDFLAGEIEFLAAHEVDRFGRRERIVRIDRDLRADHADQHRRLALVGGKRRRARVDDDEIVLLGNVERRLHRQPVSRRVEHPAIRHQRRGLREPRRIPERADLALRLITRTGSAIEAVIRRGLQKQRFHECSGNLH